MAMLYDHRAKCLAVMDKECGIGVFKRDFAAAEKPVSGEGAEGEGAAELEQVDEEAAAEQEVVDEVNSDHFEMHDLEDLDLGEDNEASQRQSTEPEAKEPSV